MTQRASEQLTTRQRKNNSVASTMYRTDAFNKKPVRPAAGGPLMMQHQGEATVGGEETKQRRPESARGTPKQHLT